jgi:hypothetical protein
MARRKKDPTDLVLEGGKLVLLVVVLIGFAAGGLGGITAAIRILFLILGLAIGAGAIWIAWKLIGGRGRKDSPVDGLGLATGVFAKGGVIKSGSTRTLQTRQLDNSDSQSAHHAAASTQKRPPLSEAMIQERLFQIDWFQFEKLNAALLGAHGSNVERKGGAHPDGGVDIIVTSAAGERTLVQCKHWRSWKVKEGTVREMLGAMTHVGASRGEIRTLLGWTAPAETLAQLHHINLLDGEALARDARAFLDNEELEALLDPDNKRCPKCDGAMALRTGNFKSFWGCRSFPRCRGVIKEMVGSTD